VKNQINKKALCFEFPYGAGESMDKMAFFIQLLLRISVAFDLQ
jgi:hypothetical protein